MKNKGILIGAIVFLILISGCSEPPLEFIGKKLKLSQDVSDCKENQYYDASERICKKIINECYTDEDCPGDETCVRKEISTSLACKVGEECPRWYHNVCELTEETTKYCEKHDDCGIQSTCCCFEALNKKYVTEVTCDMEGVLCTPCRWTSDDTLVKCINNQCKLVSKEKYCEKDEDCIKVKDGCCGCESGGLETVINKNFHTEHMENIEEKCRGIPCNEYMSDHWTCFAEPKCIDGECELVK